MKGGRPKFCHRRHATAPAQRLKFGRLSTVRKARKQRIASVSARTYKALRGRCTPAYGTQTQRLGYGGYVMLVCNADGRVAVSSLQQSAAAAEADRTTETLVLRRLPIPTATSCDLESAADHRRTGRAVVAHPAAVRVRRPRRCLGCGRAVARDSPVGSDHGNRCERPLDQ